MLAWRVHDQGIEPHIANGARDEFLFAATAQNLRKLAKLVATPAAAPAI